LGTKKLRLYIAFYYDGLKSKDLTTTALLLSAKNTRHKSDDGNLHCRFDVNFSLFNGWELNSTSFDGIDKVAALVFLGKVPSRFTFNNISGILSTVPINMKVLPMNDGEMSSGLKHWILEASQVPVTSSPRFHGLL
jgi:hypothetical protein